MAIYKQPAIVISAVIVVAAIAAIATPVLSQMSGRTAEQHVFGISSQDSVYPYRRQPVWHEAAAGRFTVTPPRPQAAFADYAVSSDPDTHRICAVYASTKDEAALAALRADLTRAYGSPTHSAPDSQTWSKGAAYVQIDDLAGSHQIMWDYTGNCLTKNKAHAG